MDNNTLASLTASILRNRVAMPENPSLSDMPAGLGSSGKFNDEVDMPDAEPETFEGLNHKVSSKIRAGSAVIGTNNDDIEMTDAFEKTEISSSHRVPKRKRSSVQESPKKAMKAMGDSSASLGVATSQNQVVPGSQLREISRAGLSPMFHNNPIAPSMQTLDVNPTTHNNRTVMDLQLLGSHFPNGPRYHTEPHSDLPKGRRAYRSIRDELLIDIFVNVWKQQIGSVDEFNHGSILRDMWLPIVAASPRLGRAAKEALYQAVEFQINAVNHDGSRYVDVWMPPMECRDWVRHITAQFSITVQPLSESNVLRADDWSYFKHFAAQTLTFGNIEVLHIQLDIGNEIEVNGVDDEEVTEAVCRLRDTLLGDEIYIKAKRLTIDIIEHHHEDSLSGDEWTEFRVDGVKREVENIVRRSIRRLQKTQDGDTA